jgi:hypothetical protein
MMHAICFVNINLMLLYFLILIISYVDYELRNFSLLNFFVLLTLLREFLCNKSLAPLYCDMAKEKKTI